MQTKRNASRGRRRDFRLSLELIQTIVPNTPCTATRSTRSSATKPAQTEGGAKSLVNGSKPATGSAWFAAEGETPRIQNTMRAAKIAISTSVTDVAVAIRNTCWRSVWRDPGPTRTSTVIAAARIRQTILSVADCLHATSAGPSISAESVCQDLTTFEKL